MDISPEQKRLWAQEVRYLHSLYRNAALHCSSTDSIPGGHRSSTNENRKKNRKKNNSTSTNSDPSVADDNPWEAWPRSPPKPTAWGAFPSPPSPPPRPPPSATDQAKAAAARVHHTALQTCEAFFSIDPAEDAEYSEMDEDDEYESNVFNFFSGIFEGNDHLRRYYKKNGERGEFICLVCAATGAKVGRQYADCVSLVQHANAISKTKRPLAHRALANVVCRVLGWDITRLPSIVLDATEQKDDLLGDKSIQEKKEINGETGNNAGHMSCAEITEIADSPNKDAAFRENKQNSRDIGIYVEIDDDSDDDEVDWDLVSKEIAFDENKQISRDIGEHIEVEDDNDDDDGVVDWDLVTKVLASQDANNGSSSCKGLIWQGDISYDFESREPSNAEN